MQNHEFYAGTNLTRYLDSTWQEWGPLPDVGEEWGEDGLQGATSATSGEKRAHACGTQNMRWTKSLCASGLCSL